MRSIYDAIQVLTSVDAQSISGSSAVTGSAIDTAGFNTAMGRIRVAAASGSPTTAAFAVTVTECDTLAGSYTTANDNTGTPLGGTVYGAQGAVAAANDLFFRIEGLGDLNRKRYLKIVITPTFTGGSSPASICIGEVILGNAFTQPTNTGVSNT